MTGHDPSLFVPFPDPTTLLSWRKHYTCPSRRHSSIATSVLNPDSSFGGTLLHPLLTRFQDSVLERTFRVLSDVTTIVSPIFCIKEVGSIQESTLSGDIVFCLIVFFFLCLQIIVHIKCVCTLCGSLTHHEFLHRNLRSKLFLVIYNFLRCSVSFSCNSEITVVEPPFVYLSSSSTQSLWPSTSKETTFEVWIFVGFNRSDQWETRGTVFSHPRLIENRNI